MTYSEFTEKLIERLKSEFHFEPEAIKFYPTGYQSDDPQIFEWIIDTNKKYSGEESYYLLKDFLVVDHKAGSGITMKHRISLQDFYAQEEAEGFEASFVNIREAVMSVNSPANDMGTLSKRGTATYDDMKKHLIIRPLNYGLHMSELKEYIYNRTADIAFVLYHLIGDGETSISTSKIKRVELERWGMYDRRDEVMQEALANTARIFPACVGDNRTGKETDFLSNEFSRESITNSGLILLSTFKVTNGALALFYPGVAEKMRKIMGGSFHAVFMNINDVLIFKRDDPMAWHYASVAKTNSMKGREMLSARVFLCDDKGVNPV